MGAGGEGDNADTSSKLEDHTQTHIRKLVGYDGFKRHNPKTDHFHVHRFDHVEFWCGDATNTSKRFGFGLGLNLVAKSDQSTGNQHFSSYVMNSQDLTFTFTAPFSQKTDKSTSTPPISWYNQDIAFDFLRRHGLAVRAVALRVDNAEYAFQHCIKNGGISVQPPTILIDATTQTTLTLAEIHLYGDVVLRLISGDYSGPYIPGYEPIESSTSFTYGLRRLDHAVGNVPELIPVVEYIKKFTGFHEFAEFVAEDVGTVDSGLNSIVLASNNEMVLLPINEPTFGTKRKSQIQTYLEQNEGPGLQHLALLTDDIFATLTAMRSTTHLGGFDFMPKPSKEYYKNLPRKIGDVLTEGQYQQCEELGILVDKDDQGILLQIFTKPLGDRPTIFIEIIQRLCVGDGVHVDAAVDSSASAGVVAEKESDSSKMKEIGACGGFGKGNFSELFQSIETYESELGIN